MTAYIIKDFKITALASIPANLSPSLIIIQTEDELAALDLTPAQRLQLWNGIPNAKTLKRAPSLDRIWQAMRALSVEPDPAPAISPVAEEALAEAVAAARKPTRQDQVLALMRRPEGATLVEIMTLTGWQKHSVRGFISGAVKKKLGLAVESDKVDGDRIYRIAEASR